jgi:hypothetical protein
VNLDAGRLAVRQTLIAIGYEVHAGEPKSGKVEGKQASPYELGRGPGYC